MPTWGLTQSDAEIWALGAFLEKQPQLSDADYAAMAKEAAAAADKAIAPRE